MNNSTISARPKKNNPIKNGQVFESESRRCRRILHNLKGIDASPEWKLEVLRLYVDLLPTVGTKTKD